METGNICSRSSPTSSTLWLTPFPPSTRPVLTCKRPVKWKPWCSRRAALPEIGSWTWFAQEQLRLEAQGRRDRLGQNRPRYPPKRPLSLGKRNQEPATGAEIYTASNRPNMNREDREAREDNIHSQMTVSLTSVQKPPETIKTPTVKAQMTMKVQ